MIPQRAVIHAAHRCLPPLQSAISSTVMRWGDSRSHASAGGSGSFGNELRFTQSERFHSLALRLRTTDRCVSVIDFCHVRSFLPSAKKISRTVLLRSAAATSAGFLRPMRPSIVARTMLFAGRAERLREDATHPRKLKHRTRRPPAITR